MFTCVEVKTKKDKDLFLSLPKKLYDKKFLTQDLELEKKILNCTHPLSIDFDIYPFILLNTSGKIVSRCVLTVYPNDNNGYVGFFESVYSEDAVNCLINKVKAKAKELGLIKLIGPIDCSIWIKYRFKVDYFDEYYTGEPYNKDYYPDLWEKIGFNKCLGYYSNRLRVPTEEDYNDKIERVTKRLLDKKKYLIISPNSDTLNVALEDVYGLLSHLYSEFPYYKYITKTQFCMLFEKLGKIFNYDMVKLVYDENDELKELIGFLVAVPNYSCLLNNPSIFDIGKIKKIKKNPKDFVLLYLGASPKHLGLGGVLAHLCKEYMQKYECMSINALVRENNQSGKLYEELTVKKYNYSMYEMEVK